MGAEERYVLRSGRWSSQGVSQSGGALRASPSLVELSGRLPVWWSSQGVSQSGGGLRAPPNGGGLYFEVGGKIIVK